MLGVLGHPRDGMPTSLKSRHADDDKAMAEKKRKGRATMRWFLGLNGGEHESNDGWKEF